MVRFLIITKKQNMKTLLAISLLSLLSSCTSNKKLAATLSKNENTISLESACPEDGKCTVEIFKNKSLNVLSDEFGSIYTQQLDNPEMSVIVYQYDRNVPKGLQDAHYREEIIFEVNNATSYLTLKDKEIQITKMVYGRFCFCRGQTGYYRVENGTLNLTQKDSIINLDLNFKINQVPQKIESIKAIIK